jgi:hypothetical protein
MSLDFITKKRLLIISLFLTLIFFFLVFLGTRFCYRDDLCKVLRENILNDSLNFTIIFPILLLVSVITYFSPPPVFASWKKFAIWAVPVVVALSIITTSGVFRGGSGIGVYAIDFTLHVLVLIYSWFFLHSLIVILSAWWKSRKAS